MDPLVLEWDTREARNPTRTTHQGADIQLCSYLLHGVMIYERVRFPYSIFDQTTVSWMIDYRFTAADRELILKNNGLAVEGGDIYDDTPGAIYAKFKKETDLLTFFKARLMKDKNDMTRAEAMQAVRNGYYVCHPMMKDREYVKKDENSEYNQIIDDQGYTEQFSEFFALRAGGHWETGWYLN